MRPFPTAILTLGLSLGFIACSRPQAAPTAETKPTVARVVIRFLDQDAVLPLEAVPSQEPGWAYMDAGIWAPLALSWKPGPPTEALAAVGRTAPAWVLLRDPAGDVHRVVVKGPGPGELEEREQSLDPEDRDVLVLLGLAWVFSWRGVLR